MQPKKLYQFTFLWQCLRDFSKSWAERGTWNASVCLSIFSKLANHSSFASARTDDDLVERAAVSFISLLGLSLWLCRLGWGRGKAVLGRSGWGIVARSVLPGQFTSNFPKCGSCRAKLGLPWGSVWEATLEPRCLPLLFPFFFVYLCTGCALRVHLPFPISCLEF